MKKDTRHFIFTMISIPMILAGVSGVHALISPQEETSMNAQSLTPVIPVPQTSTSTPIVEEKPKLIPVTSSAPQPKKSTPQPVVPTPPPTPTPVVTKTTLTPVKTVTVRKVTRTTRAS